MTKRKRLAVLKPTDGKLGRATIMDRALAQRYGAPYVHLAAFAIDVDRVHRMDFESSTQPFGWEVFLTELRLARFMDEAGIDPAPMLEEMCLSIMELAPPAAESQGVLGAQLPFAVYTAVAHGHLPAGLGHCFRAWKKPPTDLIDDMSALAGQPGLGAKLARHCLDARVDPPLVEPVRLVLATLCAEGS